ncbi:hypothetical protein PsorP6_007926 [Peronosclerospora sorghi]|uniref:Uncharacterized protein n=1 Tax=Peronosclerospora sorghi TaxID=230839 RepID=A0ACC0W7T3_9STRA|nr:hypothetical protein PsorP6_007926 [Peronosclerospora sorghi]
MVVSAEFGQLTSRKCGNPSRLKRRIGLFFALAIEDATDSLNVIVYGSDAEHFLSGIPPCDLKKSTSSKTLIGKRLTALLRVLQAFHWCIKSYAVVLPPTDCSRVPTAAVQKT